VCAFDDDVTDPVARRLEGTQLYGRRQGIMINSAGRPRKVCTVAKETNVAPHFSSPLQ
jgi:hypothetical protein